MDKNFIKIDDLFRQRLGGVEEKERSGAWLNMRDLLDKEMPQQKRIGIFYWRRIFNAVAVLSLLGTVGIGSYELSSAFKSRNASVVAIADIPVANKEADKVFELPTSEADKADAAKVAVRASGHVTGETTPKQRHIAPSHVANEVNSTKSAVAGKAIVDRPVTIDGNAKGNTHKTINTANTPGKNNNPAVADNSTIANNSVADMSADKRAGSASKNRVTHNSTVALARTNNDNRKTTVAKNNGVAKQVPVTATNAKDATENAGQPKQAQMKQDHSKVVAPIAATSVAAHTPVASLETRNADKDVITGDKKDAKMVLNSAPTVAGNTTTGDKLNTSALTPMAGTPNNPSTAKTAVLPVTTTSENVKSNLAAAPAKTAPATAGANNSVGSVAGKPATSRPLGTGGVANKGKDEAAQNKRVITRLLVHQRKIKVSETEYAEKLDTISMEKVNMDLGLKQKQAAAAELTGKVKKSTPSGAAQVAGTSSEETNTGTGVAAKNKKAASQPLASVAGTPAAKSKVAGAANTSPAASTVAATSAGAETSAAKEAGAEEDSKTVVAAEPVVGAAAPAAELNAAGTDAKPKAAAAKKGSGVSMIQRLSMAFNDVKENAAGAKLSMGITAGVNSNFFGPSSFKGFQFGLTGNLVFNNTWNIMTELKYFHRLSNGSSVEDNFYSYTPVNGQYRKDLQLNSYGFSALHSIEMPVAIRYSNGNFNFYTGGNFLYSFSINTGASTMQSNAAPEYVAEAGTDTKGRYSEEDFRSRFGLGYLLGFSYQVAPSVGLDIRSVQTVWDNAATTGAKSISGQLYKTPSIQLSIMYRLGGNRSKD